MGENDNGFLSLYGKSLTIIWSMHNGIKETQGGLLILFGHENRQ